MSNSSVFSYAALMYVPVIIYNRAEWLHVYEHICVDSNNSWGYVNAAIFKAHSVSLWGF